MEEQKKEEVSSNLADKFKKKPKAPINRF